MCDSVTIRSSIIVRILELKFRERSMLHITCKQMFPFRHMIMHTNTVKWTTAESDSIHYFIGHLVSLNDYSASLNHNKFPKKNGFWLLDHFDSVISEQVFSHLDFFSLRNHHAQSVDQSPFCSDKKCAQLWSQLSQKLELLHEMWWIKSWRILKVEHFTRTFSWLHFM